MEWVEYCNNMFDRYKQARKPFQATFEMTPFCNFRCNMCYVRLNPEQAKTQGELLCTEQWLHIASEFRKLGATVLEITGGEATTRNDFSTLYTALINMGFIIHLRTNGYLIRDDLLNLFKKYKPRRISITMYGASDETYQKVCGISDGFSVVSSNVLAMRDAGLTLRLTMTVTNDNISDLNKLEFWGKEHGLKIFPFGGLFTPIRAAKRSIDHLQIQLPEEEYDIPEDIVELAKRDQIEDPTLMKSFWMCRGYGAKCCISWDGRITICNTLTSVWKDVVNNGVEKAYRDLYDELDKLKRPRECATCPYIKFCGACPAQLLSATGSPECTCENICKQARRKCKRHYLSGTNMMGDSKEITVDQCEEGEKNED